MVTLINDLTPLRVGVSLVILLGGYLVHELCHIIPLALARVEYEVTLAPGETPLWHNLTIGRAVQIEFDGPPWLVLSSVLAPGVLTFPGWYLWAELLSSDVISLSSALLVATWIIVFLPSLADWAEAKRQVGIVFRGIGVP